MSEHEGFFQHRHDDDQPYQEKVAGEQPATDPTNDPFGETDQAGAPPAFGEQPAETDEAYGEQPTTEADSDTAYGESATTDEPSDTDKDDTYGEPGAADAADDEPSATEGTAAAATGEPGAADEASEADRDGTHGEPVTAEGEGEPVAAAGQATPGDGGDFTIERLIDSGEADRFQERWHDIKASFVDDPRAAVQQASALSEEVMTALTTALERRRENLEEHWQGGGEGDTERLRIALRGYRSLMDHILTP